MNEQQIPYKLLAKYFSEECTSEEREEVDRWLDEDLEHQLLLEKLFQQWKGVQVDASTFVIPDKAEVWSKIQARIHDRVKQVHVIAKMLLHNRKNCVNFEHVLGISNFHREKRSNFSIKLLNFRDFYKFNHLVIKYLTMYFQFLPSTKHFFINSY